MTEITQERLELVRSWQLSKGAHPAPSGDAETACVMEAVAYAAGEKWSDHPQCACPVIAAFLRNWNDALPDDATRTRLLGPLVPRLVGSRSTPEVESRRSWMALDWLARVQAPAWLDLAGLEDHSALCRELGELHDAASARLAMGPLQSAWAAAGAAAGAAARAAAWAAARDAAGAAAWDAAQDAAGDAAQDAAGAAARVAAGVAAGDRLQPTVETMQQSALELVDRMLAVTP